MGQNLRHAMTVADRILRTLDSSSNRAMELLGVSGSLRAFLAAKLVIAQRLPVLIARDQEDAEGLYRDLAFFLGATEEVAGEQGILFLGADEKSPYEEYSPDAGAVMERINTLYRLAKDPKSVRAVVVTPHAFVRRHAPPALFDRAGDYVVAGEEIDRERLLARLIDSGYNPVSVTEDPGTFSVRGGIIDVYSPHRSRPVRLDLFGDRIESMRLFDPGSQRTDQTIEDAVLLPAREVVYTREIAERARLEIEAIAEQCIVPTRKLRSALEDVQNHIHFFGVESLLPLFHPEGLVPCDTYLPTGENVVVMHSGGAEAIAKTSREVWEEAEAGYERALAAHRIALPPKHHLADGEEAARRWIERSGSAQIDLPEITLGSPKKSLELRIEGTSAIRAEILKATRATQDTLDILHPVVHRLKRWRADGFVTLIVSHTRGQAERLKDLLSNKGITVRLRTEPFSLSELANPNRNTPLRDRSVHAWLVLGDVTGGFAIEDSRLAIVAEEEIFGQRMKQRRRRTPAGGEFISDLRDLEAGDFIVHVDYGVGLYHGMTKLPVNGVESDFLNIEYKGGDKLYLPIHRLRLIQKYVSGAEDRKPPLDRLGTQTWANTKRKVKDTLLKMAAELLRLYAVRTTLEGHALGSPETTFREFEAEFAFEPTPDQAKAVEDVIADLQKSQPMDRLICGDVGYGKTEVAMRAAMLAVLAKKQVAVLVPTTVLAAQHFSVFTERFSRYPEIKIGVISRFQSKEEVDKSLARLKEGQLNIIIGTHRLLSQDITFKDIGLLVIDEEHRFGVAHKERLKKYRATVHVLSMSATPIPRTLHMGFMGVRDMSTIETPPVDRLAVKTEVHKFSEDVIRDAVLREIRRGGQCFVVHNRVASITAFARMLERLVPEARVAIGHGQMAEDQLERVMVDFMAHQYNVLLSTTIIESGIDIPNANTIIINRADALGLAQLYQLRGRVGRSKQRGFAYFLIPPGNLSPLAKKRIAVLQRFTELGAGFKVASHDLEIRGAGNLLGKQQSGTIAQVGFEMYQALLQEAISELKGSTRRRLREPEVQIPVPALIPDAYVPRAGERLAFYQRINSADTDAATFDLLQEITDLYGTPPAEVENLTALMLVKQRLERLGALGLDYGGETKSMPPRLVIRFDAESPGVTPAQIVTFVQRDPKRRKITPEGKLVIHLVAFEDPRDILQQARDQLDELLKLRLRAL